MALVFIFVDNFVDRLLRLLVTLSASTASADSLKIIKTRLRNKMEDDFLVGTH
jgi:hypothetical protein